MIAVQLNWGQFTKRVPELLPSKAIKAVDNRAARDASVRRWRARSVAPGPKGWARDGSGGMNAIIASSVVGESGRPQEGE